MHTTHSAAPVIPVHCAVERYSFSHQMLHVAGYAIGIGSEITGMALLLTDGRSLPLNLPAQPSPDLTLHHGARARACRFAQLVAVGDAAHALWPAQLQFTLSDGRTHTAAVDTGVPTDVTDALQQRFFDALRALPPGRILEIGSRMRSGTHVLDRLPPGWDYTGVDVMEGPNVDVVGDAHQLSRYLPRNSFDAAMSFVVFEHLLMPWKAAIELNRVMREGGIAVIMAPQTWALHEEPCDYFRFSKHAWKAMFNAATGFQIVAAEHGHRGYLVAQHFRPAVNFGEVHTVAMMSAVLVRKVSDTRLDWPVEMDEISDDLYPF